MTGDTFDIWMLLAGLGLFLFGIYLMEESVKELAGRAFKKMIRRYTGGRLSSILTGTVSTAILQSSSAVTLMVLAFVGAGVISLTSAVGVIIGSNIGTTLTAWIVAVFGFKISIESFALPLIALGGVGLIVFSGSPRWLSASRLLIGFGLLFHGLDYMKSGVENITAIIDVGMLAGFGLWVFAFAGIALTAVMQSSSATIAIVLTAISAGLIGFDAGAAMVIGANIGTTVTVLLGSIGGIPIKKRVAWSHVTFNLVTGLAAFLLLPVLIWIIQSGLGWRENPILGIALFHTLFNLLGIILFIPFLSRLTALLSTLFPEADLIFTHYIQNTSPEIADAAMEAFRKEVLHQYVESRNYIERLYDLPPDGILKGSPEDAYRINITGTLETVYRRNKELHGEIFDYYSRIDSRQLEGEDSKKLDLFLRSSRSIMNATKNLKDIRGDIEDLELSDSAFLYSQFRRFGKRLVELFKKLDPLVATPGMDPDTAENVLDEAYRMVEEADALCINSSSRAIRNKELKDVEATSLLMANRLFTQSCRMYVFSIRNLLLEDVADEETAS